MGGHTRDGGLMVGGSVFYYDDALPQIHKTELTEVESLDKELNAGREAAVLETQLSSLVWICTSTHAASAVTVIDANNPADVLKSFAVCPYHLLCIASIPGASPADYMDGGVQIHESTETENESDPEKMIGRVSYVECELASTSMESDTRSEENEGNETEESFDSKQEKPEDGATEGEENKEKKNNWERKGKMSSVLATMWLGAQSGMLYVHSSVANWDQCLHSVKLKDAVLSIV